MQQHPTYGRDLGLQHIDPYKIKFADDQATYSKPFRNARTTLNPEEMSTKRESIRTLGVLKNPIIRPISGDPDYTHQIVAGSLRMRCILKLIDEDALCYNSETCEWQPATVLYKTVKCQVRECDEDTAIRISIAENLEHSAVPELDLMDYCKELTELNKPNGDPLYKKKEIAGMCNRSESWVSLTLQLDELDPAYKKLMYDGRLARTGAISLVLGVKKEFYSNVIEECKEEVRQEAEAEEEEAEIEEKQALADVEDAEIDMAIFEKRQDEEALVSARRRYTAGKKRVSVASEKKTAAKEKAENGTITAETINKVARRTPGAKKGKERAIAPKSMREIRETFSKEINGEENETTRLCGNVAIAVMDTVLGKRPPCQLSVLIDEGREKLRNADKNDECVVEQVAQNE